MALDRELRRYARLRLHWLARLFRPGEARSVDARTENLGSQGFYCNAREPFVVGERLDCEVEFPPLWGATHPETAVSLHCFAHVVRVEPNHPKGGYGVACRIEEYASCQRATTSLSSPLPEACWRRNWCDGHSPYSRGNPALRAKWPADCSCWARHNHGE